MNWIFLNKNQTQNMPHVYEGNLKVKFTDVSYHHKKHGFCFQISYFYPQETNPILVKRSRSFQVLARKPKQDKRDRKNGFSLGVGLSLSKKKKDEEDDGEEDLDLDLFSNKFGELINGLKSFSVDDRQKACEIMKNGISQIE